MSQQLFLRPVKQFQRRLQTALLLKALADGTLATALAFGAALTLARLLHVLYKPRWVWLAILLLPLGYALVHLWRRPLSFKECAAHVDQRLGLHGLLLTHLETSASSWDPTLESVLLRAHMIQPHFRWRRLLPQFGLAAAFVAGALLLPAPQQPLPPPASPLLEDHLLALEHKVNEMARAHLLDSQETPEWNKRVQALQERHKKSHDLSGQEVDQALERLANVEEKKLRELQKLRDELAAFSQGGSATSQADRQRLADQLNRAQDALPEEPLASGKTDTQKPLRPEDLPKEEEHERRLAKKAKDQLDKKISNYWQNQHKNRQLEHLEKDKLTEELKKYLKKMNLEDKSVRLVPCPPDEKKPPTVQKKPQTVLPKPETPPVSPQEERRKQGETLRSPRQTNPNPVTQTNPDATSPSIKKSKQTVLHLDDHTCVEISDADEEETAPDPHASVQAASGHLRRTEKLSSGHVKAADLRGVVNTSLAAPTERGTTPVAPGHAGATSTSTAGPSRQIPPKYRRLVEDYFSHTPKKP